MKVHVSVCIPTYRRAKMLERLLRAIAVQDTGGQFEISIVVVDNDAAGSARETVERLKSELGLEIIYGIELTKTIPAVRNHALRLARGNYIGIVDDDEFPPAHWLLKLYRGIQTFDVDGALGPVHPFFEEIPPEWLIKSRFCERPVHRTGTILNWGQTRTGNVLLKRSVFDENNLLFDEKFKTGGSDREFFKQAMRLGCRFVAVEEAPVYEIVPPERWKKKYWIERSLVNGFNAHRNGKGEMSFGKRLTLPFKLTFLSFCYLLAAPVCACLGTHRLMKCAESGGHHLSRLCAMAGIELIKKRNF